MPHICGVIIGHTHTQYEYCISKYEVLATTYITEYCWYSKYEYQYGNTIYILRIAPYMFVYSKYFIKHHICGIYHTCQYTRLQGPNDLQPNHHSPTDVILRVPQIWSLQRLQHLWTTPVAWCWPRGGWCCSSLHHSFGHTCWCIPHKTGTNHDAWPNHNNWNHPQS